MSYAAIEKWRLVRVPDNDTQQLAVEDAPKFYMILTAIIRHFLPADIAALVVAHCGSIRVVRGFRPVSQSYDFDAMGFSGYGGYGGFDGPYAPFRSEPPAAAAATSTSPSSSSSTAAAAEFDEPFHPDFSPRPTSLSPLSSRVPLSYSSPPLSRSISHHTIPPSSTTTAPSVPSHWLRGGGNSRAVAAADSGRVRTAAPSSPSPSPSSPRPYSTPSLVRSHSDNSKAARDHQQQYQLHLQQLQQQQQQSQQQQQQQQQRQQQTRAPTTATPTTATATATTGSATSPANASSSGGGAGKPAKATGRSFLQFAKSHVRQSSVHF